MVCPLVSVLVLNWNSHRFTADCIESLRKLSYGNFCIIVIDNGSTDGSEIILRKAFSDLMFIQTGENLGYADGNNRGIAYSLAQGADYVWILNNDTRVDPNSLTALVDALEGNPDAGLAGSKIYSLEEPEILAYAGGTIDPWRGKILHRGRGEVDRGHYDRCEPTDFVTGCSLLIRTSIIRQCETLDPRFFLYYEDLDWNLRIQQAGFQCLYVPESRIWHQEGGSLGRSIGNKMKPDVVYYIARNSLYFYEFHLPILQRLSASTWNLLSQLKTWLLLYVRHDAQFSAYGRAVWQGWSDYVRRIHGSRK
ncbi:MAG: glycosyltransferase family 2 protein [Anaerolineae bacterium]|nr:glycosyltransferase family 2 protein [Gloeobacterales cyanobacterium ES-bin-313]